MTIYLVRHGETDWNVEGVLQGQNDTSRLTAVGWAQVQHLAESFASHPIRAVYSSDLNRAHESAKMIAEPHRLLVATDPRLRERCLGVLEGKLSSEVRAQYGDRYAAIAMLPEEQASRERVVPSAESDQDILDRFHSFLDQITSLHAKQEIVVVTHGGVIRSLLWSLGYDSLHALNNMIFSNAGYVVLQSSGSGGAGLKIVTVHNDAVQHGGELQI